MADRTVRVRLEAVTSAYQRAMEQAAAATQKVSDRVGGLDKLGGQMQAVGGRMTVGLTLPLAAAGGAAVKMATDFETAFASMVGLAGVPQAEVEGLKQSVLDLAGETGRAPMELADALYFAASAGLDAAGAMEAVEVAAKGAATGMGSTEEIVGLIASAVASYGEESINAAEAVDILTATIREGRAEPSELASTLGRVLPIASQLGVEFDDVGGAVAYLSNVFGDTNRTVTALQGFLVKLVSPSKQGRDALQSMGTSVEKLHAAIRQDGLLGALELLREKGFAGNQQALRALFDDIEGFQAALALLNDESGSLNDVMAALDDSAGAAEDAFANFADTAGFKNTQAFAQLQAALIQVGDVLVPIVADVAEFAGGILELFNSLPGPVQTGVVAFGGLLAAVGPLASIGGKLVSNWHTMGRAFDKAATGAYDLAGGMGKIARAGAVVGILYGVGQALDATVNRLERADLNGLQRALLDLTETGRATGEAASVFGDDMGKLSDAIERVASPSVLTQADHAINTLSTMGGLLGRGKGDLDEAKAAIDDLDQALAGLAATDPDAAAAALAAIREALSPEDFERLLPLLDDYQSSLDGVDVAARTAGAGAEEGAGGIEDFGETAEEQIDPVEKLEDAIRGVTDAIRAHLDPIFAAQDAFKRHKDAQDKVKAAQLEALVAQQKLDAAIKEHGRKSDEAAWASLELATAQQKVKDANSDTARTALDVATASVELRKRIEEGTVKIDEAEEQLRLWVEQGLLTEEQAYQISEELRGVSSEADRLDDRNIRTTLTLDAQQFWMELAAASYAMRDVQIQAQLGGSRTAGLQAASGGLVEGPKGYGDIVPFLLEPGEVVLPRNVVEAIRSGRPASAMALGGAGSSVTNSSVRQGDTWNITTTDASVAHDIRREQRRKQMLAAM